MTAWIFRRRSARSALFCFLLCSLPASARVPTGFAETPGPPPAEALSPQQEQPREQAGPPAGGDHFILKPYKPLYALATYDAPPGG